MRFQVSFGPKMEIMHISLSFSANTQNILHLALKSHSNVVEHLT
jgi:hypothetical protein